MSARNQRTIAAWFGAAAIALALTGPAAAADSPQGELVDQGVNLRRSGDDDKALVVFERAESLSNTPSSRLLVHLAAVHQALGNWQQADSYLTRALSNPGNSYVKRHRATLDEARRRIDRQIGTLEVRGGPMGAQVFLNGQLQGTLPLERPLRVTAGVYNLELRHPGHYSTTRSIALAGGTIARESMNLSPVSARERPKVGNQFSSSVDSQPHWLGWTFAGLSVASAASSIVAWRARERHAELWNDDSRCLLNGRNRSESCDSELQAGRRAETWMYLGMAATSVFAIGSALRFALESLAPFNADSASKRASESASGKASLQCGVGALSLSCSGSF